MEAFKAPEVILGDLQLQVITGWGWNCKCSLTYNLSLSCHIMGLSFGQAVEADGNGALTTGRALLLTQSFSELPRPTGKKGLG